jgi:uncharacterized protein
MRIRFTVGETQILGALNGGATAAKIAAALPLDANGSYWGEELYFQIPVKAGYDSDATDVVDAGTIAFWVEGSCLCLFWGPTPASRGGECRAASNVNIVGRVDDVAALRGLRGRKVRVEAVTD